MNVSLTCAIATVSSNLYLSLVLEKISLRKFNFFRYNGTKTINFLHFYRSKNPNFTKNKVQNNIILIDRYCQNINI